ncbi:hypothetical protein SO802_034248 [Lithocarpus litseifolius]|uniref:Uncharacterized protein n=1 Tax=Lithocarpus litseifolius TaxID=425828 RepID=A0AAW2BH08_9ROSI
MSFQRGRVTLSQILATPVAAQAQDPSTQSAIVLVAPAAPPVTPVATNLVREMRAGRKHLRGESLSQPVTVLDSENSPLDLGDSHVNPVGAPAYIKAFMVDGEPFPATNRGYQCSVMVKEKFLAAKARVVEMSNDNEDLLKKISNVMNKVSKSEKLRFKAEENTKVKTERKDALKKELQEIKKALAEKDAELKGYVVVDDAKVQAAYYQGQYDCIAFVKPKVQQNLQVYFSKGWIAALDKMQVEASFTLRLESNIPIPQELVIVPNPEFQAIINDKSLVREVGRASPVVVSGGEVTRSVAITTTEEPVQP